MSGRARSLEARLFRHYWDDGLLDILAGVGVTSIGVFWAMKLVALGAVVPAMLAMLWAPLRRRLVEPRAGLVEFSDARSDRNRRLGLGSIVLGVVMLALFVGAYFVVRARSVALPDALLPGLPAFLLGLLAVLVGWGLGLPRFLAYAAVLAVSGIGVGLANGEPEVAMLSSGIIIVLSGTWRFRRFLMLPVEKSEVA